MPCAALTACCLSLCARLPYGALAHVCYAGSRYKALVESIKDKECSASDVVGADEISSVVSRWTGIPLERLPQTGILHMF